MSLPAQIHLPIRLIHTYDNKFIAADSVAFADFCKTILYDIRRLTDHRIADRSGGFFGKRTVTVVPSPTRLSR